MNKIIIGLLALLAIAFFVAAESYGVKYEITGNEDLTFALDDAETLDLEIMTTESFDLTLLNSTSQTITPPSGYEILHKFTLTLSANATQTTKFVYNYDATTADMYDIEKTNFGFIVNADLFVPTATVDTTAKTVTVTVSNVDLFKVDEDTFPFAIFVETKSEPSGSVVEPSDSASSRLSITCFSFIVAMIAAVLCL